MASITASHLKRPARNPPRQRALRQRKRGWLDDGGYGIPLTYAAYHRRPSACGWAEGDWYLSQACIQLDSGSEERICPSQRPVTVGDLSPEGRVHGLIAVRLIVVLVLAKALRHRRSFQRPDSFGRRFSCHMGTCINGELTGVESAAKDWSGILPNDLVIFSKDQIHV